MVRLLVPRLWDLRGRVIMSSARFATVLLQQSADRLETKPKLMRAAAPAMQPSTPALALPGDAALSGPSSSRLEQARRLAETPDSIK